MIVSRFETKNWTVYGLRQFTHFVNPDDFLLDPLDQVRIDWSLRTPWIDEESGRLISDMGAFLLRGPQVNILIDAGIGDDKKRVRDVFNDRHDGWYSDFTDLGLSTSDVDIVLFTHLHVDHVGYATRIVGGESIPAFPNARYLASDVEYAYWTSSEANHRLALTGNYMSDSIRPLVEAGVLDLVPPDGEIAAGVRLLASAGHTPGSVIVEASGPDAEMLFIGDLMHHPVLLTNPTLRTKFCWRPNDTVGERRNLIARCIDSATVIYPAHFSGMRPGRIRRALGQAVFEPLPGTEFVGVRA